MKPKKVALLSVYDKEGIAEFAQELVKLGWEIISSGGTAKALGQAGVEVRDVADLVGGGSVLGHRVVTLSREIHAGLMSRPVKEDYEELERLHIPYIDLVCVDLYPLKDEIEKPEATPDSILEKTDVGGPTILRSAAKGRRIVIADRSSRAEVLNWLKQGEPGSDKFRDMLAARSEAIVADYVLQSARYISEGVFEGTVGTRVLEAKYGENGWQKLAGLYAVEGNDPLALSKFELVEGSSPSYNNLADIDRLLQTVTHVAAGFETNFGQVPLIALGAKHGNACGAAVGSDSMEVTQQMVTGDPRAIFGGVVLLSFAVTKAVAETLLQHEVESGRRLLDGIAAPAFDAEAVELLGRKGGKCRLLQNPALAQLGADSLDTSRRLRLVRGGFLAQPNYTFIADLKSAALARTGEASDQQQRDLILAWAIGSTSNSNTVTLVREGQLIGNGVGQQDRVGCCELAIKRATDAGHAIKGTSAYSDSFFPFPDGPEVLAKAGVAAILATSGSVRDSDVQSVCRSHQVALYQLPDSEARGFFGH